MRRIESGLVAHPAGGYEQTTDAGIHARPAQAYGGRPRHAQQRVVPTTPDHRAAGRDRHQEHGPRLSPGTERAEQVVHHVAEHPAERCSEGEHPVLLVRVDKGLEEPVVRPGRERQG